LAGGNFHPDYCSFTWCHQPSWWHGQFAQRSFDLLVDLATARDRARLRCLKNDFASAWLEPCPASALGLSLLAEEFVILCKWWLGVNIIPTSAATCASCFDVTDCFGDHALSCRKSGFYQRHQSIAEVLVHLAEAAGFTVIPGIPLPDGLKPADVMLSHWKAGGPLAIDVSIVHPLAPSIPFQTVETGSGRANDAEAKKDQKYDNSLAAVQLQFKPFVLTTFS
jgi:hypothetical protein